MSSRVHEYGKLETKTLNGGSVGIGAASLKIRKNCMLMSDVSKTSKRLTAGDDRCLHMREGEIRSVDKVKNSTDRKHSLSDSACGNAHTPAQTYP